MWRVSQALEQNPSFKWAFEFPAGVRVDELASFTKAKALINSIKNNEVGSPTFKILDKFGQDVGTDPKSAEKLVLIRKMLGAEEANGIPARIEFRDSNTPTIFPQNVTAEGNLINVPALTLAQINALLPQARQYWLDAGASATVLNRATFAVADLPFGMAGQTANNLITFDPLGAGWGWYVDATPADQTEFQATAQTTVFTAAPTSEAANKLDLLTVLIHELGHVAGLLHTAATNDVMSQYLVPGERRLPDAADLAALQAQGAPFYVSNTTSTWVTLPRGAAYSKTLGTQLQAAAFTANATLTNGSLNAADGWSTQGSVDIALGAATLNEVATSQTRLSQVFMLNPNDHYLTFTLSGAALDNLPQANPPLEGAGTNGTASGSGSSPSDAFEVALLNANTGASLLDNNGLTHSDAFLNLQADGTEHTSSGVTRILNADGSRTYRIDLTGVPAGVAANLSFDLIGFGANASHITVSDVRLSGLPQLKNDWWSNLASPNSSNGSLRLPFVGMDADKLDALSCSIRTASHHSRHREQNGSVRAVVTN